MTLIDKIKEMFEYLERENVPLTPVDTRSQENGERNLDRVSEDGVKTLRRARHATKPVC